MPQVISNELISAPEDKMYLMRVAGDFPARMGQCYMLRAWETYPTLSRPISVHDKGDGYISFMYRQISEGTEILVSLKSGDEITLNGPYGNGFPEKPEGKVALVGGGMGIAPLYLAAKSLPKPDIYLGFRERVIFGDKYQAAAGKFISRVGGTILYDIKVDEYDTIFACGPLGMEKALADKAAGSKAKLYLSLEKHMACGMGACLVCTCFTKGGNKKVCKDGPVFLASEVIFDDL